MKSGTSGIIIVVALAAIIASVAIGSTYIGSQSASTASSTSQSSSTTFAAYPSCDTRAWVLSLASQVEQNPKFISAASVSSNWLLTYAGNETENIWTPNYTTTIHETALNYYSCPNASAVGCNKDSVVYVLFVKVPILSDGSYNFTGLTAYSERFYPNMTSSSRS
ncbi:MAG: hypothetical protein ACRDF4_03610 [Rhabdochlamydiaceae bacterium]